MGLRRREKRSGERVHNDWVLSVALSAALDDQEWSYGGAVAVVRRGDPLDEIDEHRFWPAKREGDILGGDRRKRSGCHGAVALAVNIGENQVRL